MNGNTIRLSVAGLLAALLAATVRGADDGAAVTLTTGDWVNLSARYYAGNLGGKSPAVIVIDDVGEDARPAACRELAKRLHKDGWAVLTFDFRGTGGSRGVEPEFWDDPNNRQMVKGHKSDSPPTEIGLADFKPGYLPTLVNDVAAARSYLERKNDGMECNTNHLFVIGFGRGATLGQVWLATEHARYRVSGGRGKRAVRPEGRAVAGCVWVRPAAELEKQAVDMPELVKQAVARRTTLVGLIHAAADDVAAELTRACVAAGGQSGKGTLVLSAEVKRGKGALADREDVRDQVVEYVTEMRKVLEVPPWDAHGFVSRLYVWVLPGGTHRTAKDDGDEYLQPIPVAQLLGWKK